MTDEMMKLEEILKTKKGHEEIFQEFERRTINRLVSGENAVGSYLENEIRLFGRYLLHAISGKNIEDVYFGCGCENNKSLLSGNYDRKMEECQVDASRYIISDSYGYGYNADRSPEVIILHMFAIKSGFGCDFQSNYPRMYAKFIDYYNMKKYPNLYRALANSKQSEIFQRYRDDPPYGLVITSRGPAVYHGDIMEYSIKEAVAKKIGLS